MSAELKDRVNWMLKLLALGLIACTGIYFTSMRGDTDKNRAEIQGLRESMVELRVDVKYIKEWIEKQPRPQWPPTVIDRGN